jgi:hypothetical protein
MGKSNDEIITVETSCGQIFRQRVGDLSDHQLDVLIKENQNPEDPEAAREAALLHDERQRRGNRGFAATDA